MRERESLKARDIEGQKMITGRQTETDRQRQRERQRQIHRNIKRDRKKERETQKQRERKTDRDTHTEYVSILSSIDVGQSTVSSNRHAALPPQREGQFVWHRLQSTENSLFSIQDLCGTRPHSGSSHPLLLFTYNLCLIFCAVISEVCRFCCCCLTFVYLLPLKPLCFPLSLLKIRSEL